MARWPSSVWATSRAHVFSMAASPMTRWRSRQPRTRRSLARIGGLNWLGRIVTLESQGKGPGGRLLDGRPFDGSVGLAPMAAGRFSGTHWLTQDVPGGVVLKCLAHTESQERGRFLDGRTADGTVSLAPHTDAPFSGTHWKTLLSRVNKHPDQEPGEKAFLRCLGDTEGSRFLDGRVEGQSVVLTSTSEPFTGTEWRILSPAIWYEPPARCSITPQPRRTSTRRCGSARRASVSSRAGGIPRDSSSSTVTQRMRGACRGSTWAPTANTKAGSTSSLATWCRASDSTPPAVDTDLDGVHRRHRSPGTPPGGIHLTPVLGEAHRFFDPFRVDGVIGETGTFEVPSGAFSWAQQVFVFTHNTWESENGPVGWRDVTS